VSPGSRPFRFAASLGASLALAAAPASADMTKDQCLDANGKGQELRREHKLSEAREQLRACANPACPAMLRDDCTKRLDELERAQPSIVFDAKDGAGRDLSAVKVTVDGRPLAQKLDGTALQVDPGEHVFLFTAPDQPPVTQTFVLKEGDTERRERIVLAPLPVAAPAPQAPAESAPPSTPPAGGEVSAHGMGTQKILGLVAGGAGVAGLAVGSIFGVMTLSEASQQGTDCASATSCARYSQAASDHSTGVTDRTISTVGFVAGGALLVGGAVLFFTAPHASEPSAAARMLLVPGVGPGGGGMLLRGEF
jgi:hypothetical protein